MGELPKVPGMDDLEKSTDRLFEPYSFDVKAKDTSIRYEMLPLMQGGYTKLDDNGSITIVLNEAYKDTPILRRIYAHEYVHKKQLEIPGMDVVASLVAVYRDKDGKYYVFDFGKALLEGWAEEVATKVTGKPLDNQLYELFKDLYSKVNATYSVVGMAKDVEKQGISELLYKLNNSVYLKKILKEYLSRYSGFLLEYGYVKELPIAKFFMGETSGGYCS